VCHSALVTGTVANQGHRFEITNRWEQESDKSCQASTCVSHAGWSIYIGSPISSPRTTRKAPLDAMVNHLAAAAASPASSAPTKHPSPPTPPSQSPLSLASPYCQSVNHLEYRWLYPLPPTNCPTSCSQIWTLYQVTFSRTKTLCTGPGLSCLLLPLREIKSNLLADYLPPKNHPDFSAY